MTDPESDFRARMRAPTPTALLRTLVALFALLAAPGAFADDLLTILEVALRSDPEYQAAGAANRAAQEVRPQARANLLPSVESNLTTTTNKLDVRESASVFTPTGSRPWFSSTAFEISLTQPIYRFDLWIALDQADSFIRQADAEYAASRQDLMVRAADAYFGVLRAREELIFARSAQEAFGQQLKQSEQRFEVGLIAITDVEEAKAGFDLARAQVIAAENALDVANEVLRQVTGEYHEELALLSADVPLVTPEPADIDRWTETALVQNLRLAAARHSSTTAREEIKRIEAGHLPTIDLVAEHSRNKANGGASGGQSRTWSSAIGFQLNVPIYEGGEVLSQTRQSRHRYQQSVDIVEVERRRTQRETRDAYLGVSSAISRVRALEQAVRSNEAAAEAIEAGFQVGTRTSVDVLNAQRDLFLAKRDLANARYDYIVNVLRLKRAAGTLSEEDIAQVNDWLR